MLVVGKVGRTRASYYLGHLTPADDPRGGLSERPGQWLDGAAARFGLAGTPVGPESLGHLLAGRDPRDGARLHPAIDRVKVAAFDLTFAAPKSVSLLHALGPAEAADEVVAAHARSVEAALSYVARQGLAVRRRAAGGSELLPADGMLGASFVHRTSRASDPHLHTHALVCNLGADGDGRYSALDSRPLYLHLRAASALYDAHLRSELCRTLDVVWRARDAGQFDLVGLPDRVLDAFSARSRAIADELASSGRRGPGAARVAALRTRPDKDRSRPYPALVDAWRDAAYRLGVADKRWLDVIGPGWPASREGGLHGPAEGAVDPSEEARRLFASTADRLERPFSGRELLAEGARRNARGVVVAQAERAVGDLLATSAGLEGLGQRPAVLGGPGRSIPAGRAEAVFRSERLAALEADLAAALEGTGAWSWTGGRLEGTAVLAARTGGHLELLDALAARARAAAASGWSVRAHAPTARDATAFEALTGIPTGAGPRPPLPGPDRLLVVVSPDELPLDALVELVTAASRRPGALALVVGPATAPSRDWPVQRDLLVDLARPLGDERWTGTELAAGPTVTASRPDGGERAGPHEPGVAALTYATSLKAAVGLAIAEVAGRRRAGERAVIVVPDRPAATGLDRLVPGDARRAVVDLPPVARLVELAALAERRRVDTAVLLGVDLPPGVDGRVVRLAVSPMGPLERPSGARRLARGLARDGERHARPQLARTSATRPDVDLGQARDGMGWDLGR